MEEEWALFEQARAASAPRVVVNEPTDVEGRWLSFQHVRQQAGPLGATMTWDEYEAVRVHFFMPQTLHTCTRDNCTYLNAKWGQQIMDPRPPHEWVVAGGLVYLCTLTGSVHVCDNSCVEQQVNPGDAGTVVCPISGRFKESLINNREGYYVSDHQLMTETDEMVRRENAGRKRAASKKQPAPKRKGSAATEEKKQVQYKDAKMVCRELLCSGALRRASQDQLAACDRKLRDEVVTRVRRSEPVNAMQLVMIASKDVTAVFESAARLSQYTKSVPSDVQLYLEQALLHMFTMVRQAPGASEGGNDINLRKMCFALAYILRRGLVGCVQINTETGQAHDWALMSENDPWSPPTAKTESWERHVFVPAHPGLRNILPDEKAVAHIVVPGFGEEMASLMRKTRRLGLCFLSVLRCNDRARISDYCLASKMKIRPDILLEQ